MFCVVFSGGADRGGETGIGVGGFVKRSKLENLRANGNDSDCRGREQDAPPAGVESERRRIYDSIGGRRGEWVEAAARKSGGPGVDGSEVAGDEWLGISACSETPERGDSSGGHDGLWHGRDRRGGNEGGSERLRVEAVFAGRDAHGHPQRVGCPQAARGAPLAARSFGQALCTGN